MNIFFYIKLYVLTFLVFLGIDSVWLVKVAPNFYKQNIGHLMTDKPNLLAALIFYIINIIGIIMLAVVPALNKHSWTHALIFGAVYGLVTYATYDLTNLATLRDWPLKVTIVDLIWGTFLSASVAVASYFIANKLM